MKNYRVLLVGILVALLSVAAISVNAQDMATPSVDVSDQAVLNGTVTINSVYSEGFGFVVIHIDNGSGAPGPVAGYQQVFPGWNYNVQIWIDATIATPRLFAMLHTDTGTVGTYEFGTVEGADGPVKVNDQVVTPGFNVDIISAADQFVADGAVTIPSVTAQVDGWLVIHSDNDGAPGPVLGASLVSAGTTANVKVELTGDATSVLWPMLHVDTGTVGTYEFGTVEGADGPVVVNGTVAVTPFWTVPHVRMSSQIALYGDGMMMDSAMAPTVVAASVLSDGPGFLVIHQEADGKPGPVAGVSDSLPAGLSTNVTISLDPAMVTARLWPMLHVDTGTVGTYEFGTVEGADGPVKVNDQVVTFPIDAAPSLTLADQPVAEAMMGMGAHLVIPAALIDGSGWLVIHSDNNGAPGPVLGQAPLHAGLNTNVVVEIDAAGAGAQVFPMLHYDTGTAGVYEFGTVEGADSPVFVGGAVVFAPMAITQ